MNKFLVGSYMVICLVLFSERGFSQSVTCSSPNGRLSILMKTGTAYNALLHYSLQNGGVTVVPKGVLGLEGNYDATVFAASVKRNALVNTSWETVYGERKKITDNYNSLEILYTSASNAGVQLQVSVRMYNEGMAYRYRIVQKNTPLTIQAEHGIFTMPAGASAWVSNNAQALINEKPINEIREEAERPLTVRINGQQWLALGEAGLVDFARMKFIADGKNGLETRLSGSVKGNGELTSPWRYVMVAGTPAKLLEQNYFILNLNEPCRIKETAWIKPGKALRETTLTTKGSFASIDFAAAHGISYIVFDAGWYGREDHDTSDATRVSLDPLRSTGSLDMQEVIRYGKTKNIGVILYVNRRALERQLDTLLPLYEKWGVKGLKFGFVQVGSQQWTSWLHEAIRKAANHHLLVDIHDEYRPTGYTRTYPNLLTQEGIRGDEESPYIEQTIKTIFTRMIAGPADNTNCYFTERVNKMGSHAAQLAKALCIYSPLNFLYWYDHPAADTITAFRQGVIQEVPELEWYNKLPVVWDETKVLEGNMEDYATIARRKDQQWFIGSLNGTKARTAALSLSFLDKRKKYMMVLYEDDPNSASPTHIRITKRQVNIKTLLKIDVGARNGFALMITEN